MPLDHYVTLGRSGLRVSPLCLGAMTFGEDLGWGSSVEESQRSSIGSSSLAATSSTPQLLHKKPLRIRSSAIMSDATPPGATASSSRRIQRQPLSGRPQRRRIEPKTIISSCEDSLRRLRRTTSISMGCTTGTCTRRSRRRCRRSRTWCAPARSAISASPTHLRGRCRGEHDRAFARLGGLHRAADRVFAARAQRRAGARADGPSVRARDHAWSPLKSGALSGKYTRRPWAGEGRPRPARIIPQREDVRRRRRARASPARTTAPWRGSRWPGSRHSRCDLDHHRRAAVCAARSNVQAIDGANSRGTRTPRRAHKAHVRVPAEHAPMFPAIHNGGTTVNGVYAPTTATGSRRAISLYRRACRGATMDASPCRVRRRKSEWNPPCEGCARSIPSCVLSGASTASPWCTTGPIRKETPLCKPRSRPFRPL